MSYFLQFLISTQKPIMRQDKEEFRKLKKKNVQNSLALEQQMKKDLSLISSPSFTSKETHTNYFKV